MTRIFLRRGTSSDLSSVVLATGEAAYATDTKVLKIGDGGTSFASLSGLTGGTAGGVSAFTALSDTPSNFSGAGNRFVKVNSSANALEFVAGSGGGGGSTTFVALTDTPANFTSAGGKFVKVNSGATALEFVAGTSSGGISGVVDDTNPQLGGDLDAQSNNISSVGTITANSLVKSGGASSEFLKADGSVDSSTYLTSVAFSNIAAAAVVTEAEGIGSNDNDTTLPTSAAVKDYVDNNAGGGGSGIASVAADTSPQLGGDLDVDGNDIVSASNGDIDLLPNGNGKVVFRGGGTGTGANGAGRFKLNCENNSHGITIQGPPHSAGANYTLTLPNDDGSADQLLKTDGNGVLSWANDADTNTTYTAGSGLVLSGTTFNATLVSNTGVAGGGSAVANIVTIASGDYTALGSKDANTLYFLT
jgi:hypothetical protein